LELGHQVEKLIATLLARKVNDGDQLFGHDLWLGDLISTKPSQDPGEHQTELIRLEHTQFSYRSHVRIQMSFEAGQQLIGGVSGLRIVQRAGIKRHRPAQELHRKDSLLVLWQSLESL
jgi:hypothetical protein